MKCRKRQWELSYQWAGTDWKEVTEDAVWFMSNILNFHCRLNYFTESRLIQFDCDRMCIWYATCITGEHKLVEWGKSQRPCSGYKNQLKKVLPKLKHLCSSLPLLLWQTLNTIPSEWVKIKCNENISRKSYCAAEVQLEYKRRNSNSKNHTVASGTEHIVSGLCLWNSRVITWIRLSEWFIRVISRVISHQDSGLWGKRGI